MSTAVPQATDGYVDLLQIDLGTIDGDSNVYVATFHMRRAERTTPGSAQRIDIARAERTAAAVAQRVDE